MNLSRREFLAVSTATVALGPDALRNFSSKPQVRFGLITDPHYADTPARGHRYYRESLTKIQEPLRLFKQEKVDRILELGDLIDSADPATFETDLKFLKTIHHEIQDAGLPVSYVLGNHCLNKLDKATYLKTVGQKGSFTRVDHRSWTVLTLDACFRVDGTPYNGGNFDWTDTFVPDDQIDWIRDNLTYAGDNVLVCVHQRLDQSPSDSDTVKSCLKVRDVLQSSSNVRAVFQGHAHVNDLKRIQGVPYATVQAIVEGSGPENNAYSILDLYDDGTVRMVGYRRHAQHPWAVKPEPRAQSLV